MSTLTLQEISATVTDSVFATPILDMHTHLYPPTFGTDTDGLMLWGIDELLTYHYLIAEVFRTEPTLKSVIEKFWRLSKREQADYIFQRLFLDRAPISEACRGVLTTLQKLGLDPAAKKLDDWRSYFDSLAPNTYIDSVMKVANVEKIVMTNGVFDDNERKRWLDNPKVGDDPRFAAVLRIDPLIRNWPGVASKKLSEWGYVTEVDVSEKSIYGATRFLHDWLDRTKGIYIASSLDPEFRYPAVPSDPAAVAGQQVLERVILPVCRERNLPLALMIGSKRSVNPILREAGDMVGLSDVSSVVALCRDFPDNRFFVTMLARENQHELAVAARKFGNLMVFGCWWFVNNPSLIEEITTMRVELLGTSFIPQHSDARVLDQLIYKWDHSRQVIAKVLTKAFTDMATAGRPPTKQIIDETVRRFFSGNFNDFVAGTRSI